MVTNRSVPPFGFKVRLRIGQHLAQLAYATGPSSSPTTGLSTQPRIKGAAHSVHVPESIADVDPASWGATSIELD